MNVHYLLLSPQKYRITLFKLRYQQANKVLKGGMSRFKARWPQSQTQEASQVLFNRTPCRKITMDFFIPDKDQDGALVFTRSLKKAATVDPTNNATDEKVIAICAASAICSIITSLRSPFMEAFRDMGIEPNLVKLPSQAEALDAVSSELHEIVPIQEIYVRMGVLMILIYKYASENNYSNFIRRRIRAMSAKVGLGASRIQELLGESFLSYHHAMVLRRVLGGSHRIRRAVILASIQVSGNEDSGLLGSICQYVNEIVAWTDMTAVVNIFETLVVTQHLDHLVFHDRSLRWEVLKLKDALRAVIDAEYPQFFGILANRQEASVIRRSNFPVLAAVADQMKINQNQTMN